MRIFVAGAGGAIGRHLVPQLVEHEHEVTGLVRTERSAAGVLAAGADVAVADALDGDAVLRAVARARPQVIVHELTSLAGMSDLRHVERDFEQTNLLRSLGTDHLLAAARESGVRRVVAQSFAGWPFAREGGPIKTEEDPLDPDPPKAFRTTLDAIRYVERAVAGANDLEGVALRYGGFYGPGTSLGEPEGGAGGEHLEAVRRGRFPIVGGGTGVWSFVHIEDAASATVAAVERGPSGIYHVVDDDPAPVSEWLPALAAAIGAGQPRRVPTWAARLLAGEATVVLMTESRGASNAKAKRELGWRLRFPTWRDGFLHGLARRPSSTLAR